MASPQVDLFSSSIGLYVQVLESLESILVKAAKSEDAATFPTAKLAEDMFDLTMQVRIVCTYSLKSSLRIVGIDLGKAWEDEKTIPAMIDRVRASLALVKSVDPAKATGKDATLVTLERGKKPDVQLPAAGYALGFATPNIFFHLSMVYAILRSKGVPLGKDDYLDSFTAPYLNE